MFTLTLLLFTQINFLCELTEQDIETIKKYHFFEGLEDEKFRKHQLIETNNSDIGNVLTPKIFEFKVLENNLYEFKGDDIKVTYFIKPSTFNFHLKKISDKKLSWTILLKV